MAGSPQQPRLEAHEAALGPQRPEQIGKPCKVLGIRTRWVALAMVPLLTGAIWAHLGNGRMFGYENEGWEYPLYLTLLAIVQGIRNDTAGFYSARSSEVFDGKCITLRAKFACIEAQMPEGPDFAGPRFSLVDAAFGPVFRYFDVLDRIADFGILSDTPRLAA